MPSIRVTLNKGARNQEDIWVPVTDVAISNKDGNIHVFTLHYSDGSTKHLHLFKHDNLTEIGASIFSCFTNIRSANSLMVDWAKKSPVIGEILKEGRAGRIGNIAGGAVGIVNFLKTKPLKTVGYYDGAENLVLDRVINAKNKSDYNPS